MFLPPPVEGGGGDCLRDRDWGKIEQYKANLLGRVSAEVQSWFREEGFSRWGKDWLRVLELGPFNVELGPVRDMWLEMFDNVSCLFYLVFVRCAGECH